MAAEKIPESSSQTSVSAHKPHSWSLGAEVTSPSETSSLPDCFHFKKMTQGEIRPWTFLCWDVAVGRFISAGFVETALGPVSFLLFFYPQPVSLLLFYLLLFSFIPHSLPFSLAALSLRRKRGKSPHITVYSSSNLRQGFSK